MSTASHPHTYISVFIHSFGMCRTGRFLAVLRCFFHSSLLCTFPCHPSPQSIPPSSLTSSCLLFLDLPLNLLVPKFIYRVSQEEWIKLWESVPYVKLYRYNPKHLYPKLNGYGDNGQRKLRSSCGSKYCTCPADAVSWAGTVRIQSTARTLSSVM